MLEAHDLVKRYGPVRALDGFTLSAAAGEIVGLLGHNGAGKTTFVEITANLIRADSGRITVDGKSPADVRGMVGISPQRLGLYPSLTPREHLRVFAGLAGLRGSALRRSLDELVVSLRMTDFVDRPVGKLSGGQQRRTQVATALLGEPPLLLLDEPTAGADMETREAMLDAVKRCAAGGAAVVYTTHYLPELTELGATIAVARDGRVIARGTYADLVDGLPGEIGLTLDGEDEVRVSTTNPTATLIDLLSRTDRQVSAVEVRNPTLDDLYRSLAVTHVR
ncbi:ABC transporter ATP-binding protein [Actinokineospora sp. 24-640]